MRQSKQQPTERTELALRGLAARRGGRLLFAGLSARIESGQMLLLSGANGSGKSTLLRILAGLRSPQAGSVSLRLCQSGQAEESRADLPRAAFCHYIGDKNGLKPQLTLAQNLRFWQRFLAQEQADRAQEQERARRAMAALKITACADLPCAALSAGQKRRAALCRLLISPRPLWLLDEPTSALDSAGQELFAALMRVHLTQGGLIAAATHVPLGVAADSAVALQDYRPGGAWLKAEQAEADEA